MVSYRAERQGGKELREQVQGENTQCSPISPALSVLYVRVGVCLCVRLSSLSVQSSPSSPRMSGGLPFPQSVFHAGPMSQRTGQGSAGDGHSWASCPPGSWHKRLLIAPLGSGNTLLIHRKTQT